MKTMLKGLVFAGSVMLASALLPATEANACARMRNEYGTMATYNGCSYTIMGNFRGSDGSWGGFGPIAPGRSEANSMSPGSAWGINHCNYEAWKSGTCKPKSPHQIRVGG